MCMLRVCPYRYAVKRIQKLKNESLGSLGNVRIKVTPANIIQPPGG